MEYPHEGIAEEETPQTPRKKKKNNKMKNKRRFSDEQIRLLESIFESETKLEPRKKLQLARELGLQPRQVAIWFQNRRARWKSKQIEQDYRTLRANYDNLESRFESLKKEKQSLMLQMQKLSELVAEPDEINNVSKAGGLDHGSSTGCGSEYGEAQQFSFQLAGLEEKGFLGLQIEKDKDMEAAAGAGQPSGREEFLSVVDEYRKESPASPENLYGFDSADMFDHSCSNPQWLNFWT